MINLKKYDVAFQYCDLNPKTKKDSIDFVLDKLEALKKRPILFALTSNYGNTLIQPKFKKKVGALNLNIFL